MAEEQRRDLRMIGNSASKGGKYRNVKLTGEGSFDGDVDCVKLSQIGELKVKGGLRAEAIKLTGECEINGALEASKIGGRGELKVKRGLRAEKVRFTGNVDVGGNCEAGTFEVNGAFEVDGLVSADGLDVRFFGPCRAREIGGGRLRARRSRTTKLITDQIEGAGRARCGHDRRRRRGTRAYDRGRCSRQPRVDRSGLPDRPGGVPGFVQGAQERGR
ncbi:hypothetical protein ACF3MZ_15555 [Paenibacillaceae bacterium WGS1546]|uniref:hypothetical protein n=1 Tax=Cohnella sp. WGS1546 TaxID=3366810 RepID=UPI00372CFF09